MLTLEEARLQQRANLRKSLLGFFGSVLLLSAACLGLYFADVRALYIGIAVAFCVLVYVISRTRVYELFSPREFEGEVTYFNVRTEMVKKYYSHQAGATYNSYTVFRADISVTNKKGKTRYKTFRFADEYDDIRNGDKAILLRFVDPPIIK